MSEFYREYLNKHGYLKRRGRGTIGSETPGEGTEPPGSDRLPRAAPRQDDSRPRTPSSTLKVDMKLPHQCLFPQNHSPPMLVGFNLPPQSSCSICHVCHGSQGWQHTRTWGVRRRRKEHYPNSLHHGRTAGCPGAAENPEAHTTPGGRSGMGSRLHDFVKLPGDSQHAANSKNQPTAHLTDARAGTLGTHTGQS